MCFIAGSYAGAELIPQFETPLISESFEASIDVGHAACGLREHSVSNVALCCYILSKQLHARSLSDRVVQEFTVEQKMNLESHMNRENVEIDGT